MQIITGKYRARKLQAVDSSETRPTLARVKESIFNLIFDEIAGSVVLDLFAGSGAFGAECISRSAEKVYFVDAAEKAIKTIKTNTKNMVEDFEIVKSDYLTVLADFKRKGVKFDLVYLDPPYSNTTATYNENNAWGLEDDYELFRLCDKLTTQGVKWGMSNVFENKGNVNQHLIDWVNKNGYNVHFFDGFNYVSCGKGNAKTVEVFISNY